MRPGSAPPRRLAALVASTLVAAHLSGCGLVDDLLGGSALEEAIEYAPAETTSVRFVDRSAIAERLGVEDVGAETGEQDFIRYVNAYDDAAAGTRLLSWVSVMRAQAAFSDLDVEWESATYFDDTSAWSWKLSDEVDLDDVAADLEDAGYEMSGSPEDGIVLEVPDGTRPRNGLYGGRYPAFLEQLALFPDEHLVVSGDGLHAVVDVVLDDADSLVDEGGFDDLLEAIEPSDDLELVQLARSDGACPAERVPPARGPAADQREDLGTPQDVALTYDGSGPVTGFLRFADEEQARADLDARADYLREASGRLPLAVDHELTPDGSTVRVDAELVDASSGAVSQFVRAEAAVPTMLACGTSG